MMDFECQLKTAMAEHSKIMYRPINNENFKDTCFRQGYLAGYEQALKDQQKWPVRCDDCLFETQSFFSNFHELHITC